MKIKILFIAFLAITQLGCKKKEANEVQKNAITVVTPSDFKEKSKDQTIIDIRTPEEFKQGHIENAVNINFFDSDFLERMNQYDKEKPLFIYCRSGNRTSSASKKLARSGFQEVYDLQGGILNWMRSNNEINK